MKKYIISILSFLLFLSVCSAQDNINSYNTVKKSNFEVSLNSGIFFGGKISDISFGIGPDYSLKAIYKIPKFRFDAIFEYTGAYLNSKIYNDKDIYFLNTYEHFIQIGTIKYFTSKKLVPFVTFTLGGVNINTKYNTSRNDKIISNSDEYSSNIWKLAATAGAGLKYSLGQNWGLMLQGRLLLPMLSINKGVGVSVSPGGIYPHLNLNSFNVIMQGDFNLGVFYKF